MLPAKDVMRKLQYLTQHQWSNTIPGHADKRRLRSLQHWHLWETHKLQPLPEWDNECPQWYKDATIASYIQRALTQCSTWKHVLQGIEHSTQVLLIMASTRDIDNQTKRIVDCWHQGRGAMRRKKSINLVYRMQYTSTYKDKSYEANTEEHHTNWQLKMPELGHLL